MGGWIVLLLIVGAFVAGRVTGWTRVRVKEPVCGRCRYAVRGLTSTVCPECGANLTEVGIIVPGMGVRRRAGLLELLATWTVGVGAMAVVGTILLGLLIPKREHWSVTLALVPASGAPGRIAVDLHGTRHRGTVTATRYTMFVTEAGGAASRAEVGWPSNEVLATSGTRFDGVDGMNERTARSIASVMSTSDSAPEALDAGRELLSFIDAYSADFERPVVPPRAHWRLASTSTTQESRLPGWFVWTSVTLSAVLWLLGVVVIRRGHAAARVREGRA